MKNLWLLLAFFFIGSIHPCSSDQVIKTIKVIIKVIAVPGLRGNTKKIPSHVEALGFKKGEYAVVRFSDVDEQGEWYQRESYLGQLEDVKALDEVINRHEGPLNLIAESRGAATAINWDGLENKTGQVTTIVAEACFLHVQDVLNDKIKPFRPLPDTIKNFIIRHKLPIPFIQHKGCPLYDPLGLQPESSIKKGTTPLLLIAAEKDHVVPGSHTPGLYKIARDAGRTNVHMLIVPGTKHTGNLLDLEVQKVVHAFWAHYGAPHNPELARQGALAFQATQPDF